MGNDTGGFEPRESLARPALVAVVCALAGAGSAALWLRFPSRVGALTLLAAEVVAGVAFVVALLVTAVRAARRLGLHRMSEQPLPRRALLGLAAILGVANVAYVYLRGFGWDLADALGLNFAVVLVWVVARRAMERRTQRGACRRTP